MKEKFKTEASRDVIKSPVKQKSNKELKNEENYCEWRKVSMEHRDEQKISYNLSSYEN